MSHQSKSKVYFFFESPVHLNNRTALKSFIESIFRKEGRKLANLNYIFCTDERLLKINQQFLQHDYYTDIISFELSDRRKPLIGEVYISINRVKENAFSLGEPIKRELHRVIFHGALHFCGYKDKRVTEVREMRKMEDKYLELYL